MFSFIRVVTTLKHPYRKIKPQNSNPDKWYTHTFLIRWGDLKNLGTCSPSWTPTSYVCKTDELLSPLLPSPKAMFIGGTAIPSHPPIFFLRKGLSWPTVLGDHPITVEKALKQVSWLVTLHPHSWNSTQSFTFWDRVWCLLVQIHMLKSSYWVTTGSLSHWTRSSLFSLDRVVSYPPPDTAGITDIHHSAQLLCDCWIWTQVLMLVKKALYPLNHLPSHN